MNENIVKFFLFKFFKIWSDKNIYLYFNNEKCN